MILRVINSSGVGPLLLFHCRTAWGIYTLTGSWELFQNSSPVTGVVRRRPHIVHGEENKQSSESKQSKTNLTKQNWWNGKRETTGGLNLVSRNNCVQCNICKWVENSNENAIALFAFIGVRVGKYARVCVPHNNQYLLPRLDTLPSYREPSPQ